MELLIHTDITVNPYDLKKTQALSSPIALMVYSSAQFVSAYGDT